jgi:hypothetical protein
MKTKELSVFPNELLKIKEIVKKQRWIENSGYVGFGKHAECATKKILKMKDDPTMYMKTQGHVTQCHSQLCEFEGGRHGLALLPAPSRFTSLDQRSTAIPPPAESAAFHFMSHTPPDLQHRDGEAASNRRHHPVWSWRLPPLTRTLCYVPGTPTFGGALCSIAPKASNVRYSKGWLMLTG